MVKSDMFNKLRKSDSDDYFRGIIYKSDIRYAFFQRKINIIEKQIKKDSTSLESYKYHTNKTIICLQICVIIQMFAIIGIIFNPVQFFWNSFHNMEANPIVSNISHSMQSWALQCMEQQ